MERTCSVIPREKRAHRRYLPHRAEIASDGGLSRRATNASAPMPMPPASAVARAADGGGQVPAARNAPEVKLGTPPPEAQQTGCGC